MIKSQMFLQGGILTKNLLKDNYKAGYEITSFTVWVTPEEVENINTAVVYGGIHMYLKTE